MYNMLGSGLWVLYCPTIAIARSYVKYDHHVFKPFYIPKVSVAPFVLNDGILSTVNQGYDPNTTVIVTIAYGMTTINKGVFYDEISAEPIVFSHSYHITRN
jgi:hypothetical protein